MPTQTNRRWLTREHLLKVQNLEQRIRVHCSGQKGGFGACWLYQGPRQRSTDTDYAQFRVVENGQARVEYVHRIMYVLYKGDMPPGMEVSHLCENKRCCNPDHLELASPQESKQWSKENKEYLRRHLGDAEPTMRIFIHVTGEHAQLYSDLKEGKKLYLSSAEGNPRLHEIERLIQREQETDRLPFLDLDRFCIEGLE